MIIFEKIRNQLWQFFRWEPLGALAMLVLAVALVAYADWIYRRRGAPALRRQWIIAAIGVTAAFDLFPPFLGGWQLLPLWAPIPVFASAVILGWLHKRPLPTFFRITATSLVFWFLQLITPSGIS